MVHYPPSKLKYNLKNPAVTLRIPKELNEKIIEMTKTNRMSKAAILKKFFMDITKAQDELQTKRNYQAEETVRRFKEEALKAYSQVSALEDEIGELEKVRPDKTMIKQCLQKNCPVAAQFYEIKPPG